MILTKASFFKRLHTSFLGGLLFFTISSLFSSCKKEEAVTSTCSFSSPLLSQTFSYRDTIPVSIDLNSNFEIERVDVQVSSNSYAYSLPLQTYFPGINSIHLTCDYPLNDKYMESGIYYVQIILTSNGETFRFNREFTYAGMVKQAIGLFYLSTGNPQQTDLFQLDFSGPIQAATLSTDYINSAISSKTGLLNICGESGGLTGFDLTNNSIRFHHQPAGTGTISSVAYCFDKEVNYIGCSDGNIQGINELGQREFQTGANQYLDIFHVFKSNDILLADFYKSATMDFKIGSFFFPSGAARNEAIIDFEIASILPLDAQNVRIIGNRNNHGLIYDYSISTNSLTLKRDQNGIVFRSAISIDTGALIFTDQGLWTYSESQGGINVSATDALSGTFDDVNNVVYCYSAHKIYALSASSFLEMNQLTVADSVLAVHVLYNK